MWLIQAHACDLSSSWKAEVGGSSWVWNQAELEWDTVSSVYFILFCVWVFYLCLCLCIMCMPSTFGGFRVFQFLWDWNYGWLWPPCGFWEENPGFSEKQPVLLATKLSVKPQDLVSKAKIKRKQRAEWCGRKSRGSVTQTSRGLEIKQSGKCWRGIKEKGA